MLFFSILILAPAQLKSKHKYYKYYKYKHYKYKYPALLRASRILQVQVPAQQGGERELSRKCVLSSDYSLLSSSLPAPEADHDENYVGGVGDGIR